MSNSITGQLRFPDRSFDAEQADRLEEKMTSKTEFRNLNRSLRIYTPSSEKGFWESKADREYSQLTVSYGTHLSFIETGSYDELDADEEVIIKENTEDLFKYFIELCETTEPVVAWIHDEYPVSRKFQMFKRF